MAQAEQNQPKFVNQIEEAFARILDYYHIRWEYEPRTFDLEWDEMGAVSVAFTPISTCRTRISTSNSPRCAPS